MGVWATLGVELPFFISGICQFQKLLTFSLRF